MRIGRIIGGIIGLAAAVAIAAPETTTDDALALIGALRQSLSTSRS